MRALGAALLLAGCATTPPAPRPPPSPPPAAQTSSSGARLALERFVAAAEARRFDEVFDLLTSTWRERYGNADRLARDFEAEPAAAERLRGIRAAAGRLVEGQGAASLEWAPGRVLRLVLEPGGWRISQLD